MDLTNSYWHIELTEETKPLLAFQTNTAQYVWDRLPQGTAPSMSIMAEAVQDTIYTGGIAYCTTCYVDNIIVTSNSWEDHKKDLEKTIVTFMDRGWKANPAKSHLFMWIQHQFGTTNYRTRSTEGESNYGTPTPNKSEVS